VLCVKASTASCTSILKFVEDKCVEQVVAPNLCMRGCCCSKIAEGVYDSQPCSVDGTVSTVSDMCFILLGEAGAWFEVTIEARVASCSEAAAVNCILHVQ
jgi:hypothetical protein